MKIFLLIISSIIFLASCSAQNPVKTGENEVRPTPERKEELRISDSLILPHYLPISGALSKDISVIDNPKGLRVKYSAPRLISSYIYVQSLEDFSSKEKDISSQATYFAEANVINLRRKGIEKSLLLPKSIVKEFSRTNVAYNRVIREDTNKVLHLYVTKVKEKVIWVQAWSDFNKESNGNKMKFDTFVYHLVQDLESQLQ